MSEMLKMWIKWEWHSVFIIPIYLYCARYITFYVKPFLAVWYMGSVYRIVHILEAWLQKRLFLLSLLISLLLFLLLSLLLLIFSYLSYFIMA